MKRLKFQLIALLALLCSASLVSCGSDDADQQAEEKKASQFQYTLTFSDDILDIADVTVYYIDTDNNEKSETVTSTTWTKTMNADKFDVSAGVLSTVKLKEGATLTKDTYNCQYNVECTIISTANGSNVDVQKASGNVGQQSIDKDSVKQQMENENAEASFKVDAQGKIGTTELSWENNYWRISSRIKVVESADHVFY